MRADEIHSLERAVGLSATSQRYPLVLVVSADGRVMRRSESCSVLSPHELRTLRMATFAHLRDHRERVVTMKGEGDIVWTFVVIGERCGRLLSVATGVEWREDRVPSVRPPSLDSPLPMLTFDRASCTLVAANEPALRAYGYSVDELAARALEDICAEGQQERLVEVLVTIADEPCWSGVWRQQRKDGSTFDAEFCWVSTVVAGRPQAVGVLHSEA